MQTFWKVNTAINSKYMKIIRILWPHNNMAVIKMANTLCGGKERIFCTLGEISTRPTTGEAVQSLFYKYQKMSCAFLFMTVVPQMLKAQGRLEGIG